MRHLVIALSTSVMFTVVFVVHGVGTVWAQDVAIHEVSGTFILSNTNDFTVDVRSFDRGETLFIRIQVPAIDFTGLDFNESRLTPSNASVPVAASIHGVFDNHFDGTYTTQIDLDELPNTSFWTWKGVIADDQGKTFQAEAKIVLEPSIIAPDESSIRGVIEEVGEEFLIVHDRRLQLIRDTNIRTEGGKPLDLSDLKVGDVIDAAVNFNSGSDPEYTVFRITRINIDRIDEVIAIGEITELGEQKVVIRGLGFEITGATRIIGLEGEEKNLEDLETGTLIQGFGQYLDEDSLVAILLVEIDNAQGGFCLEGVIESLNASSFVVEGTFFTITNTTVVIDDAGVVVPASLLEVGQFVSVNARLGNDGLPIAISIKQDEGVNGRISSRGIIDQISNNSLVVQGRQFALNDATIIVDENGRIISSTLLRVGLSISINGQYDEDGALIATLISLDGDVFEELALEGEMTEISDGGIIVRDVFYLITDGTIISDTQGNRLTYEDLTLGIFVNVVGNRSLNGILTATEIEIERLQIDLEGVVVQVDAEAGAFIASGIPFLIQEETKILGPIGIEFRLDRILPGTRIRVEGFFEAIANDGVPDEPGGDRRTYKTVRLEVLDEVSEYVSLIGSIDFINEDIIGIEENVFSINEMTSVLDKDGEEISFSQLRPGMIINVQAVETASDLGAAFLIQVEEDGPMKLAGTIETVLGQRIFVSGVSAAVNDETQIFNAEGDPTTLDNLKAGMLSRIQLKQSTSGGLIALRINVLRRLGDEIRVTGPLEEVREKSVVVLSREFYVTAQTRFTDQNGNAQPPGTIAPGTTIQVRGDLLPGGESVALSIASLPDHAERLDVMGAVDAIEDNVINVQGIDFLTDETTGFLAASGDSIQLSDLEIGSTIELSGVEQVGGIRQATLIQARNAFVASGRFSNLINNEVSLLGMTYEIDGDALILGERNSLITLDAFSAGRYVEIRGISGPDGGSSSFRITKVKLIQEMEVQATSIEEVEQPQPSRFVLHQNYPNPFNPATAIQFVLREGGEVNLQVYSILGQRIRTFQEGVLASGEYIIEWDGKDDAGQRVASGTYFYRLQVGEEIQTRQMMMIK